MFNLGSRLRVRASARRFLARGAAKDAGNHQACQSIISVYNQTVMKIIYRDQEWELEGRRRVKDVLRQIGLLSQAVLAVRDGKLLTNDVMLEEDDEVKLVAVISGG